MNETPQTIMHIESGKRYHIVNKKSEKPIDLDIRDNKTVQCWTQHEGTNQQVGIDSSS